MNVFDAKNRSKLKSRISSTRYDLIIIGGGITGAGIVLDAASRGIRSLLIEKSDFASGTSSKSTKLIHGGLRYLKQFEIALVREVGRERAVVHRLAPHLVKAEKMLLPLIRDGTFGSILTSVGLMVYDVLAGVEKIDQRKMLSKEETLQMEPLLREDILEGGGIYAEYRTDDARLTMEVLKTAGEYGADIINYAEAKGFIYDDDGRVCGISWKDNLNDEEHTVFASYTISAAGPWVDELRGKNQSLSGKQLHLTKGVHIVVDHDRFPIQQSVYFDIPDGRMIFAIPRGRITYIGTTDTDYKGDLNNVRADIGDVEYLIDGVNHIFPRVNLSVDDVESTWVGLRPLIGEEGKSASQISRKDEIFESDSGLLSIAGGKLTGFRKMAERIVDMVAQKMKDQGSNVDPCSTDRISLTGGPFPSAKAVDKYLRQIIRKLADKQLDHLADHLVSNFGKQTNDILDMYEARLEPDPLIRLGLAELQFTIEHEAVFTLLDFFERRSGRLYFDIKSINYLKEPVSRYMQDYFSWSEERYRHEVRSLDEAIRFSSHFDEN